MNNDANATGTTLHLLRGSRYQGAFENATTTDRGDGWLEVRSGGSVTFAQPADIFTTELEAKAEAKARRAPRRERKPVALYGDYAQLAAFSGLRTDGTGRRAR